MDNPDKWPGSLFTQEQQKTRGQKIEYEDRMFMQATILCAYLLSAIATGLLLRYARLAVGTLPAISVSLIAMYGLTHGSTRPGVMSIEKTRPA